MLYNVTFTRTDKEDCAKYGPFVNGTTALKNDLVACGLAMASVHWKWMLPWYDPGLDQYTVTVSFISPLPVAELRAFFVRLEKRLGRVAVHEDVDRFVQLIGGN